MYKYNLSIVIPSLNAPNELINLLKQLKECKECQIILINQSKRIISHEIQMVNLNELILEHQVSASKARNIGAHRSKGRYILFLDDDAIFFENSHIALKNIIDNSTNDYLIFNKGYTKDNKYFSNNPDIRISHTNHWTFIKFITEWNICIKNSIFKFVGGFSEIGPGSNHLAKCGEAFVLGSKLFKISQNFEYYENIKISHPPIWSKKPYETCIGYYYGAGYAVGMGLKDYSIGYQFIWILRTLVAGFRDLITSSQLILSPIECDINKFKYKFTIFYYRILGLFDGVINSKPRENK